MLQELQNNIYGHQYANQERLLNDFFNQIVL